MQQGGRAEWRGAARDGRDTESSEAPAAEVAMTEDSDARYEAPLLGATLPEIRAACASFASESAFPYYWCRVMLRNLPAAPIRMVLTNFPSEWIDAYRQQGWSVIDPVLSALERQGPAFALEELRYDRRLARRLVAECERFGLDKGLCVHWHTVHGQGGHLVLAGMPAPPAGVERDYIVCKGVMLLGQVWRSLREILDAAVPSGAARELDERQRVAMSLSASGCTVAEIATRMHVSVPAIEKLLLRAQRRLGAKTHKESLVRAVAMGQIKVMIPDYYAGEQQFFDLASG